MQPQDITQILEPPPDLTSVIPMAIVITLSLAVIPAMVARMKGHNWVLWYLYGCIFLPSALVQSLLLRTRIRRQSDFSSQADEVERWARLRDQGLLTDAEFERKKKQVLRSGLGETRWP
jgi:hypothetical protein